MNGLKVKEYQVIYPNLNKKHQKEKTLSYNRAICVNKALEAQKGMIVKKISKPDRKGTRITYRIASTLEELDQYKKDLDEEYRKVF